MTVDQLGEQVDELRDRILILERRTIGLVKLGPGPEANRSPYNIDAIEKALNNLRKENTKT